MTLEDYPNPQTDPESCGRYMHEPSFLCDPAKLLSEQDGKSLFSNRFYFDV